MQPAASGAVAAPPTVPDGAAASAPSAPWDRRQLAALGLGLAVAVALRLVLLPTQGFRDDLDGFVRWTHEIASAPLGDAYRLDLSFPPVMTYVWAAIAALVPQVRSATDGSDVVVRVAMKMPAVLADTGLALAAAYALRARPRWAIVAALAIALHPAVLDVGAWWGQYDSVFVLSALVAFLFAAADRPALAAAALGVCVSTKPEALPFLFPFGGWFLGRLGPRRSIIPGATFVAVVVALWLPFVPAGGPFQYLGNLAHYEMDLYTILSVRAWNLWWIVQSPLGGAFASDTTAVLGPITFRSIAIALTALGELAVFWAVLRRPTARQLALGCAVAVLVAFTFLTSIHERYAFGAVVFFALLLSERPIRWIWLAFSILFTANLLAAVPFTQGGTPVLPLDGPIGIVASAAMVYLTLVSLGLLYAKTHARPLDGLAPSGG